MKKSLIVAALSVLSLFNALSARAELGDNYATSCKRYGGKGTAIENKFVAWYYVNNTNRCVAEMFRKNQCEFVRYLSTDKLPFAESEVWRMLIRNGRSDQTWHEYKTEDVSVHYFTTNDDTIYARWTENGTWLEIAYKSWIDRHVGFKDAAPADNAAPPVQEQNI